MKKVSIWAIIIVITLALVMFGCGTPTGVSDETEEGASEAEAEEVAPEDVITLTMWGFEGWSEGIKGLVEGFEEVQDKYKLDYIPYPSPSEISMATKWAAGDRPDIMNFHGVGSEFNKLAPITENLISLSDEPFQDRVLYPSIVDITSRDGESYAVDIKFPSVIALFYNKKVAADIGIALEDMPGTLDELMETFEMVKEAGMVPTSESGGDVWSVQTWTIVLFNSEIARDKTVLEKINTNEDDFTQSEFVDGVAAYLAMLDAGYFNDDWATLIFPDSMQKLMDGEAFSKATVDNVVVQAVELYGLDTVNETLGTLAMGLTAPSIATMPSTGESTWMIPDTGNAEGIEGAKVFLEYLTGGSHPDRYQKMIDTILMPPMFEGFDTPVVPVALQEAYDLAAEVGYPFYEAHLLTAYGPFETFTMEMLLGQKTPLEVGEAMSDEFRKNAEAMGLPGF